MISTGGGHNHKPGCMCPYCASNSATGEADVNLGVSTNCPVCWSAESADIIKDQGMCESCRVELEVENEALMDAHVRSEAALEARDRDVTESMFKTRLPAPSSASRVDEDDYIETCQSCHLYFYDLTAGVCDDCHVLAESLCGICGSDNTYFHEGYVHCHYCEESDA